MHEQQTHLQQIQDEEDAYGVDREEGQDESSFHEGVELRVGLRRYSLSNSEFRLFLKNNMPQVSTNKSIYIRFSFLGVVLVAVLFVVLKACNPTRRLRQYDVEEAPLVERPREETDPE